jgi:FkbH-like protein
MTTASPRTKIKCVVWDLDDTVWDGVLLESDSIPVLKLHVLETIKAFDQRGILQSISSKNDFDTAMAALVSHGIDSYFLYPQMGWGAKSGSITRISEKLNINLDTFAFVDDQEFERDEVLSVHPMVRVYHPESINTFVGNDDFVPLYVTDDSKNRRSLYLRDIERSQALEQFDGPEDSFLRTLDLSLTLKSARESDLYRAEELTIRTNQLNTTGITYSVDDLRDLIKSEKHQVIVAELTDKYGSYGAIGLVLISEELGSWCIDLFLMSCRVMSRGVGGVLLSVLRLACREKQLELKAKFKHNDRNRIMFVTYRFAGFEEQGDVMINNLSEISPLPDHMQLTIDSSLGWIIPRD